MDSSNNGLGPQTESGPTPLILPVGYQLDATPPRGYVLDNPATTDPYPQDKPTPLDPETVTRLGTEYPAYLPFLPKVVIRPGTTTADDDRQSETYPPDESENPNPGKITIQPYHKELLKPDNLRNMVSGELLHIIGGKNGNTGQPNDPTYYELKQKVAESRTPHQQAVDEKTYEAAKKDGDTRSFDQWFDQSRLDEYLMGYVTPDKADEWRKNGWYADPKMNQAVESVRKYLTSPPKKKQTQQ